MAINKSPKGTEFWLCFIRNYKIEPGKKSNILNLELFISGDKDANVEIEITSINFKKKLFVNAGTIESVKVPPLAEIRSSEIVEEDRAVHIKSDTPIQVYGLSTRYQTTDTYLALPTEVLGKDYRVMCYGYGLELMAQFAVVATEDNTVVTIVPEVETSAGVKPGEIMRVVLNKGDVYQVAAKQDHLSSRKCDFTGTKISATKNISVFSGHQCAYVPENIKACNHLVEQVPPISTWGKHFYVGKLKGRSEYRYRVMADQNNTKIYENSKLISQLNAGEFIERASKSNVLLTSNKQVLVSQYSLGYNNGDSLGDPMMILISPTQQFLKKYRLATPVNGEWNHYINVVVPTQAISSLLLNGFPVDSTKFEVVGISRYSIASIEVPFGTHTISASEPFGLYSYGFGHNYHAFDAYGTMGGQSFTEYIPIADTVAPVAVIKKKESSGAQLIIRDDREEDTGLKRIDILYAENIDPKILDFDPGSLQAQVIIRNIDKNSVGKLVFAATDESNNKAVYTICHVRSKLTNQYDYIINEGDDIICETPTSYIAAFAKMSFVNHSADFSSQGNLMTPGTFSDAQGLGGGFGFAYGTELAGNIYGSIRLNVESLPGYLLAGDTIVTLAENSLSDEEIELRQSTELDPNSWHISLGFATEYYLERYLYLLGGININFAMGNNFDKTIRIVYPDNYFFPEGRDYRTESTDIESFRSLNIGLFAGVGFKADIDYRFSVFYETYLNPMFLNLIDEGSWKIFGYSMQLGVRYRI